MAKNITFSLTLGNLLALVTALGHYTTTLPRKDYGLNRLCLLRVLLSIIILSLSAYRQIITMHTCPYGQLSNSTNHTAYLPTLSAYCQILTICTCFPTSHGQTATSTSQDLPFFMYSTLLKTTRPDDDYGYATLVDSQQNHNMQSHDYCSSKYCFTYMKMYTAKD